MAVDLYDFAGQGKTIKQGANSLTSSNEEERQKQAEGHINIQ
jgi:hypothetical protein